VFSDEARAPAAGGGPASGWRGRGSSAQQSTEKKQQGGGTQSSAHRGGVRDSGGGRTVVVVRSDSDVVDFRHGRCCVRDGRARGELRRGEGAARTVERRCRSAPLWHGAGTCAARPTWAHGSHVAMARRQVGPAWETATDRWAPHVEVGNYPRTKIAQNKYLAIEKNSRKFCGGRKSNLGHFS
jgi:hypothetical protein